MTEQALLLDTRAGTIAAVVTLPDSTPAAGVLILEGSKGTRSGPNQLWVRLARELREHGVATLRSDYAGISESWDGDVHNIAGGARDVACWFADRVGEIVIVAECYGLTPARGVCREDIDIAGIALIAPPLYPDRPTTTRRRSIRQRLRLTARRIDWWRTARRANKSEDLDPTPAIAGLVERAPTRIFSGERDACRRPLEAYLPDLQRLGTVDLEVAPGLKLHRARTHEAQTAILEAVVPWVRQCLRPVEQSA